MYRHLLLAIATFVLWSSQIVAQSTIQYNINFSDQATNAPNGWLQDYGLPFGNRGSVSYGWLEMDGITPLDLSNNGRNRPPNPDVDVIQESFIHMEYTGSVNGGNSTEGMWVIELPNGTYRVKVRVGDSDFANSSHALSAEGTNLLFFTQNSQQSFNTVEKVIVVQDGRLTIDSENGENTKLISIEITDDIPQPQPFVISSIPEDGQTNVSITTSISANNLDLPNISSNGATSVDNHSISTNTVQLFEVTSGNILVNVPSSVNGTGGGDAINLTPIGGLKEQTTYIYRINGVRDLAGYFFEPYEITFTTGRRQNQQTSLDDVAFTKQGTVASGARYTSLVIGPDGKFYGLTISGAIHRWRINSDGSLGERQVLGALPNKYGDRAAIGLAFDPSSTPNNLTAYVTHCSMELDNAPEWDGKLSRLKGDNLQNEELLITNLPRSVRDHLTNSIAFRPGEPRALYFIQSSNSAGGAIDAAWGNRPERLLTAAVLRLDLNKLPSSLPINAKTSMNQNAINNASVNSATTSDGLYNPYYTDAPLTMYATGVRNAYDLVWHSNGQLYVPTNGTAGGSNTPASVNGTRRFDGTTYNYSDPNYPQVSATTRNETQRDWLFRIDPARPNSYYGHPNPLRGEYVMNRAARDVKKYPNGLDVDANYRGAAFDFDFNKSPNGVIEYKNNQVFGGALANALLVVRYSNGDDIIALVPNGTNGDINTNKELIPGFTNFEDPLELVEDVNTGNIYVSEYREDHPNGGLITLLTPNSNANRAPMVNFVEPSSNDNFPIGTDLYVKVEASDTDGNVQKVELYLNGTLVRAEGMPPYEWGDPNQQNDSDLQNLQQGTYLLRAVATDNDGATAEQIIEVTVGEVVVNNNPPTVAFAAPQDNQEFPIGTDLYVRANASDSDGSLTKVDLFLNGTFVRSDNSAPYEWGDGNQPQSDPLLQNLAAGTYTLKAVATDNEGASAETSITIQVNDANSPIKDIYYVFPAPTEAFVSGSDVNVLVEASDDLVIRRVTLHLNGEGVGVKTEPPYLWGNTDGNNDALLKNMAPGTYELKAVATYTDNTKETELTTFIVESDENVSPTVRFVTPENNQSFPVGTNLYVEAEANDENGEVASVTLYLNDQLVRTEEGASYIWGDSNLSNDTQLQNMQAGNYSLKLVALDNEGASSESTINITVGGNTGGGGSTTYGEAIPWVEPFNLADGATSDGAPTSWRTRIKQKLSAGFVGVENEKMKVTGSSCDWFSVKIDVSEVNSVELSAEVQGVGALENSDDIKMAYRAEGTSSWSLWNRPTGAFATKTVSSIVDVSGKNFIEVAFRVTRLEVDETFLLDNISVKVPGSSSNTQLLERRTEEVVFESAGMLLYPNPSQTWTQIDLSDWQGQTVTVEVINAAGQTVWKKILTENHLPTYSLEVARWAKGAYFVQIENREGEQVIETLVVD